jgi:competence protein ComGC
MTGNRAAKQRAYQQRSGGFSYVFFILFLLILSLMIGSYIEITSKQAQRMKEDELVYVGKLYQDGLKKYFRDHQLYPASVDLLLCDGAAYPCRRYLRQLYPDPITGKPFKVILSPQNGIIGVSSSSNRPILNLVWAEKYHAGKYSDVMFIAN